MEPTGEGPKEKKTVVPRNEMTFLQANQALSVARTEHANGVDQSGALGELGNRIEILKAEFEEAGGLYEVEDVLIGLNQRYQSVKDSPDPESKEELLTLIKETKASAATRTKIENDEIPNDPHNGLTEHLVRGGITIKDDDGTEITYLGTDKMLDEIRKSRRGLFRSAAQSGTGEPTIQPDVQPTKAEATNKVADMRFDHVVVAIRQLEAVEESKRTKDQKSGLTELRRRRDQLIKELEVSGGLDDIVARGKMLNESLDSLRTSLINRSVTQSEIDALSRQLREELVSVAGIKAEGANSGVYTGVREFVLMQYINEVKEVVTPIKTAAEVVIKDRANKEAAREKDRLAAEAKMRAETLAAQKRQEQILRDRETAEQVKRAAEQAAAQKEEEESRKNSIDKAKQSEAEQLRYVRDLLNTIETSKTNPYVDPHLTPYVSALEKAYDRMYPRVEQEVRARLSLHDCYFMVKQAGGQIDSKTGHSIPSGTQQAIAERGHAIDHNVVEVLFKDEMQGMQTAKAWDLLQIANYKYKDLVRRVNRDTGSHYLADGPSMQAKRDDEYGPVDVGFNFDPINDRKNGVRDWIIGQLGNTQDAAKALELVEHLMLATLETSVLNRRALTGVDDAAEYMGIKQYRKDRAGSQKTSGPLVTREEISGFGTSYLRKIVGHLDNEQMFGSAEIVRVLNNPDPALAAKFNSGAYGKHMGIDQVRLHALKGLLLEKTSDPKNFKTTDYLNMVAPYFDTAFPRTTAEGKALRRNWLMGLVDVALANKSLGWTHKDLEQVRVLTTTKPIGEIDVADPTGQTTTTEGTYFVDAKDWEIIDKRLQTRSRSFSKGVFGAIADNLKF